MIELTLPYPISGPGVYLIVDANTGRFYIGSSVNVKKRWLHHTYRLKAGTHANPILQAIWNSNPKRLSVSTLWAVSVGTREALLQAEQIALDAAGVGTGRECMNVLAVAGSHLGRKRSAATCLALSIAQRGKKASAQTREKQRMAKLGRTLSLEHRRNLSAARTGLPNKRPKGIYRLSQRALSAEQVVMLRARRAGGLSWRLLGIEFGIHQSAAKRVALGVTYQDVR